MFRVAQHDRTESIAQEYIENRFVVAACVVVRFGYENDFPPPVYARCGPAIP
jgi:hypothetical protein